MLTSILGAAQAQDGKITFNRSERELELRVAIMPHRRPEDVVMGCSRRHAEPARQMGLRAPVLEKSAHCGMHNGCVDCGDARARPLAPSVLGNLNNGKKNLDSGGTIEIRRGLRQVKVNAKSV